MCRCETFILRLLSIWLSPDIIIRLTVLRALCEVAQNLLVKLVLLKLTHLSFITYTCQRDLALDKRIDFEADKCFLLILVYVCGPDLLDVYLLDPAQQIHLQYAYDPIGDVEDVGHRQLKLNQNMQHRQKQGSQPEQLDVCRQEYQKELG